MKFSKLPSLGVLLTAICLIGVGCANGKLPKGFAWTTLYKDDFSRGMARWKPTDPGAWALEDIGGGATALTLTKKPSEYWYRQCRATYQSDKIGTRLLDVLGEDNVMWGSDFPHPDGVWPDSQEFIEAELGHLDAALRHKVVCANAAELYGFG